MSNANRIAHLRGDAAGTPMRCAFGLPHPTGCWDFAQVCQRHAQRLSLRLDLRVPGTLQRIDALLDRHRPGPTPLRLDLLCDGAAGMLDLNGPRSVRVDADLPGLLRAQAGVKAVKVALGKPWAS